MADRRRRTTPPGGRPKAVRWLGRRPPGCPKASRPGRRPAFFPMHAIGGTRHSQPAALAYIAAGTRHYRSYPCAIQTAGSPDPISSKLPYLPSSRIGFDRSFCQCSPSSERATPRRCRARAIFRPDKTDKNTGPLGWHKDHPRPARPNCRAGHNPSPESALCANSCHRLSARIPGAIFPWARPDTNNGIRHRENIAEPFAAMYPASPALRLRRQHYAFFLPGEARRRKWPASIHHAWPSKPE